MTAETEQTIRTLNRNFLQDFPSEAARQIEALQPDEAISALVDQPTEALERLWEHLSPDVAATLLRRLPDEFARTQLESVSPNAALTILGQLEDDERDRLLALVDAGLRTELETLMVYPDESAGRLMETRFTIFRPEMTVAQALERLRLSRLRNAHTLHIVDSDGRLTATVSVQDVAIADLETRLREIAEPVVGVVQAISPREEVVELLERHRLPSVPVVDLDGKLVGVVRYTALVQAVEEAASVNIQTMVGASRDERALSPVLFAVRKRLPWLQINLLTAFLAASVVGLFEDTIARFTALAVLLPVVAGQSGNAGAQALAVTMRALALREISVRQWFAVTFKEVNVGLINGVSVAVTCGIGVYFWSGSIGLVLVIAMSMVLAMVAAGFAGAIVPIALKRLGQDPAQSSSIVLTTVTDIAGFFSFLGIATLLAGLLTDLKQ